MSVHEVVTIFEVLNFGKCKGALISGEIDGKWLMKCSTEDDVKGMDISLNNVKASVIIDEIRKWKINGVPMEYLSVHQGIIREDNDAEDRIDEVKDNQGEAGTNGNDHEDSVLDDTSPIESVFGNNHVERVVDDASCKVS